MNPGILNKKQVKKILEILKKQWDFSGELDYAFFISPKEKIYIVNKDIGNIDMSRLRINSLGIYFGELKNDELRLSIEGSQLIGLNAKKNVLELDDNQAKQWMQGIDLEGDFKQKGYVIIKNKKDFLGCGRISNSRLFNFVPKTRRLPI